MIGTKPNPAYYVPTTGQSETLAKLLRQLYWRGRLHASIESHEGDAHNAAIDGIANKEFEKWRAQAVTVLQMVNSSK